MIYEEMLELCDRHGIIFLYDSLQYPLNGTFISCDGLKTIILADRISGNHPLRNVVMAEELGHYYTLAGNNMPKEHWNRLDRINFTKDEARAIRWAANYLLPKEDIIAATCDDITSIPALAEYFDVTPNFVIYRLSLPDMNHLHLQLQMVM